MEILANATTDTYRQLFLKIKPTISPDCIKLNLQATTIKQKTN